MTAARCDTGGELERPLQCLCRPFDRSTLEERLQRTGCAVLERTLGRTRLPEGSARRPALLVEVVRLRLALGDGTVDDPHMLRRTRTSDRLRSRLDLRFRDALAAATRERQLRNWLVTAPDGGTEFAWIAHERSVMSCQVNRACAELGLPSVESDAVVRVEHQAVGHHDYVSKFALYCAELVRFQASVQTERPHVQQ